MPPSSRGPLFVWACLPEQPDLAGVYTALAGIGCDNISFVSDLSRIPMGREDSPAKESGLPKDSPTPSMRPASSHTASSASCSRSVTPPSAVTMVLPQRERSPTTKSELRDELEHDLSEMTDESDETSENNQSMANLQAFATLLGQHANMIAISAEESSVEPGSSVDLSFLKNVPHPESKEKYVTCQICEKSFSRNARNVSRHAATHFPRAAARYTCGKCGEAFGRNDRAKYHVDTKHGGNAELHDKAKDAEFSNEWVNAVKQCFPGFDFSPRDTHARGNHDLERPSISKMLEAEREKERQTHEKEIGRMENCKLCAWTLVSSASCSLAIEHASSHCPVQFTCSSCGEQTDNRQQMETHCFVKHSQGEASVIDSSANGDDRVREFSLMCFPTRKEELEKVFIEKERAGAKKRRIDSLFENKKKLPKLTAC